MKKTIFIITTIFIVNGCSSVVEKTDDGQSVIRNSSSTMLDAKATYCESIWHNDKFAKSLIGERISQNNSLKEKYQVAQKIDPKRAEAIRQEELNKLRQRLKKSNNYHEGMLIYGQIQLSLGQYDKNIGGFKLSGGLYRHTIISETISRYYRPRAVQDFLSNFNTVEYAHIKSEYVKIKSGAGRGKIAYIPGRTEPIAVSVGNTAISLDIPIYTKESRGITYVDKKKAFYLKMPYKEAKRRIDTAINTGEQMEIQARLFYKINECKESKGKPLLYGQVIEAHFYDLKHNKVKGNKIFSWYSRK